MTMIADRIRGMVVGGAMGDALGVPFEFGLDPAGRYTGELDTCLRRSRQYGLPPVVTQVGQVSDDTEMATALTECILAEGGRRLSHEACVGAYIAWANSGVEGMGRNTRALFRGISTYKGYLSRFRKNLTGNAAERMQSNGALMRCGVLALFGLRYGVPALEQAVWLDCRITNPNEVSFTCCLALTRAVAGALAGETVDQIRDTIRTVAARSAVVADYVERALRGDAVDVSDRATKGWCMYGIYCAVYALAHADDYDSAMRHIIGLRGDTDTNACIAGTLLGAVYGYDALCRSATFARNVEIMLACDTSESSSPRPEKYLFRSRLAQVEPLVACFAGSAE